MRFVITWAQNNTPVHQGFLASLKRYCRYRKAELKVIPGRYKNPTSVWARQDREATWAEELQPFLVTGREKLCRNLTLYGEIKIRPTAGRPLTGFETFGGSSGIFGHPKRAWETVATDTRNPRILVTTGAITKKNYTDSKEGYKGDHHHVFGAAVVEIDDRTDRYFIRHIGADSEGRFFDLDRRYTPDGVYTAVGIPAMALGDLHVAHKDQACSDATDAIIDRVKPKTLILHDVLDMRSGSPHDKGLRTAWDKKNLTVRAELEEAAAELARLATKAQVKVIRANHDDMLDRWFENFHPERDPKNARTYFELGQLLFDQREGGGEWPGAFSAWLGLRANVTFAGINERVNIGGVAYGFHGHRGIGGSKGTLEQFARLGVKSVTGHGHGPGIRDGAYRVGVGSKLDHGYNTLPSNWLQAHCLHYPDNRRTLIPIIEGEYTF